MGELWGNIKYFLGGRKEDDEVEYETESTEEETTVQEDYMAPSYDTDSSYSYTPYTSSMTPKEDLATFTSPSDSIRVHICNPQKFEDSRLVVDALNEGVLVSLNLTKMDNNEAKKVFDFCNGAVYSMGGKIEKIKIGVYYLAPPNVYFTGDVAQSIEDELVRQGMTDVEFPK